MLFFLFNLLIDFILAIKSINKLNKKNNKELFDIGCATGTFLQLAQEDGFKVKGIDVSKFAIDIAKKQRLKVKVSSIESYKPKSDKFSVITAWEVLPNFEQLDKAMENIKFLLKPNGILAVQLIVVDSLIFYLCRLIYKLSFGKVHHLLSHAFSITHSQYFSRKTLNRLLKENGFKIIKKENVEFNFRFSNYPKILLPFFNIISFFSQITGKTNQYRVYARYG